MTSLLATLRPQLDTAASGGVGAVLGWALASATDKDNMTTIILTFATGALAAALTAVPKIIIARSKAKVVQEEPTNRGWSHMLTTAHQLHEKEMAYVRGSRDESRIEAAVVRESKHNALGECWRLGVEIRLMEKILAENGVVRPEVVLRSPAEIIGDEDARIQAALKRHCQP